MYEKHAISSGIRVPTWYLHSDWGKPWKTLTEAASQRTFQIVKLTSGLQSSIWIHDRTLYKKISSVRARTAWGAVWGSVSDVISQRGPPDGTPFLFFFGATAQIWALVYLHETSPFHFGFLDLKTVGRTPWAGDQLVTRPLPVHKHRKMHTH
jgi:hypothetical protein